MQATIGAEIRLDALTKSYGDNLVLPGLDATLGAGEFTVILGPSGCGKSTLLNLLAGLERVTSGRILMNGREVQGLAPRDRGVAMVFQNYALYPHMTVAENIGYALKIAGVPRAERDRRIAEAARTVALGDYLTRRPGELSGGQRQRVAIARAIVREPSVMLFDEPLSNLDAQLRHGTRMELAALHRRIGASSIFVTHDQVEAMTLADRILILNKGRIEQFDTPEAIYRRPASTFVAGFIGAPPMNLLDAIAESGRVRLASGTVLAGTGANGPVTLGIRPETIHLNDVGEPVVVDYVEDLGGHHVLAAHLEDGQSLRIVTPPDRRPEPGERLHVSFAGASVHLFDAITGRRLADPAPIRSEGVPA
ncbi:ABC transporter ATP-binding protein [Paracoccus sp. S1E-3]|uniref:ABC transporter ATP-binding protein n=1 Tax=Paracoccus sp. S1E-3 TaxID=2756130 RepID=UPI0015EF64F8|nr:sn-glycerol-3-phosphate ABC transporter ATP-binding protein UgpC [Paracoccus sp. S1E-3]MBA4489371.1 sn-glycerol-3-phosphate ABC transporter ATP-binding protein UgpC [Paracoccus sp. S1E-3]